MEQRRLYHFTKAHFGLDDIRRAQLKIAQISDLNDPFELRCMDTSAPQMREAYDGWRDQTSALFGVVCFTERWDDILQWAHYADRHRGICLGFDVAGVSYADATIMRRVRTSGKLDPVKLGEAYGTVRERLKDSERKTLAKRCSEKDSDKATYYMDVLRAESCRL